MDTSIYIASVFTALDLSQYCIWQLLSSRQEKVLALLSLQYWQDSQEN